MGVGRRVIDVRGIYDFVDQLGICVVCVSSSIEKLHEVLHPVGAEDPSQRNLL